MNTESDGRMVVGGTATLENFGVATKLPVDRTRIDLATGGDPKLEPRRHQQRQRDLRSGSITPANFTVPNGTVTKAAPPFDVQALFDGLVIRSTSWSALGRERHSERRQGRAVSSPAPTPCATCPGLPGPARSDAARSTSRCRTGRRR